jgi:hypothetical protein
MHADSGVDHRDYGNAGSGSASRSEARAFGSGHLPSAISIDEMEWSYLSEVADGDEGFFLSSLEEMDTQLGEFLQRLASALEVGNPLDARAAMHRIQPSLAMIGQHAIVTELKATAALLKSNSRTLTELRPTFDWIHESCVVVRARICDEIRGRQTSSAT